MNYSSRLAASAALVASFASLASAQTTTTWIGASGGNWNTASNWSGGVAPNNDSFHTIFNNGVTPGNVSMGNNGVRSGSVTFENTSGTYDFIPGGTSGATVTLAFINNSTSPTGNVISAAVRNSRGSNGTGTITFSGSGTALLTLSGSIQDQSALRPTALSKTSTGILIFSGTAANTYTAGTTVSAGRLELSKTAGLDAISGSTLTISGGEVRHINANQINNSTAVTLSGGHLNLNNHAETLGALSISGSSTLSLGTGTLTLSGASTTFASGQTLNLGISSLASFGRIDAGANSLVFGGTLNITGSHSFTAGDSFDLFNGSISGTFANVTLPTLGGGLDWNLSQLYTDGVISVIPEPSTYSAFAGLAAAGLVALRRRRR